MSQATLELKGSLSAGGSGCVSSCSGSGGKSTQALGFQGCAQKSFETAVSSSSIQISTTGVVGAEFVDLDILDALSAIEFLYLTSSAPVQLRIGAAAASLLGSGGTFPTTFAGGETLILDVDGTSFTTTFDAADQSAAQCAARINAAAALAGLATPRAIVASSGQLQIDGVATGSSASVEVTGGTGAATLGLSGSASGAGADVPVYGTFLGEFGRSPDVPARIQVSGQATLNHITAAGKSA